MERIKEIVMPGEIWGSDGRVEGEETGRGCERERKKRGEIQLWRTAKGYEWKIEKKGMCQDVRREKTGWEREGYTVRFK